MTNLSILVISSRRHDLLELTLAEVLRHRSDECEVIAVHDGDYHDPYDLVGEVDYVRVRPGSSLVESVTAGVRRASSAVVHVLAAGMMPGEGWCEPALRQFDDPAVAAVAPLVVDASHADRVRCAGVRLGRIGGRQLVASGQRLDHRNRFRWHCDGPNLVASFYRVEALEHVGGLDSRYGDELADLDLGLRMQVAGDESAVAVDSIIGVDEIDLPKRVAASTRGRDHQRFLRDWSERGRLSHVAATGANLLLECLTSVREPSRLAAVWGRIAELRHASVPTPGESSRHVVPIGGHRTQGAGEGGVRQTGGHDGATRRAA